MGGANLISAVMVQTDIEIRQRRLAMLEQLKIINDNFRDLQADDLVSRLQLLLNYAYDHKLKKDLYNKLKGVLA